MNKTLEIMAKQLDMNYVTGKNRANRISSLLNDQVQYTVLRGDSKARQIAEERRFQWETARQLTE